MILQLIRKKELTFERTYPARIDDVWAALTRADLLRQWWGVEHTTIPECEVDLTVGGRIALVMEGGEGMGKYAGTRWPLEGTFTEIEPPRRLVYQARSWTEGEEQARIEHVNTFELREDGAATVLSLRITITDIGSGVKAKVAAYGMRWGYKAQLDKLGELLAG